MNSKKPILNKKISLKLLVIGTILAGIASGTIAVLRQNMDVRKKAKEQKEIDYYDDDVDERSRKKFQDDRIHRAKHLYDHLRYRDGSRISMAGAS